MFLRPGHLHTNADTIDTDEPCPEIVPEVVKALQSSFVSIAVLIGIDAFLLTFPFRHFDLLYPSGQLHPLAESYILALKFYPVLNLVRPLCPYLQCCARLKWWSVVTRSPI